MAELQVSAPGRICLFGEHQDFLGLPVVAAAIDLRIAVRGTARADQRFVLQKPDLGTREELDGAGETPYSGSRDYLRAGLNVMLREGARFPRGYDAVIRSRIPINAGVSSSSALVIAWLRFLAEAAVPRRELSPRELAVQGYRAEVAEFHEPGGMMDHYAAALGGVITIDTRPPFTATEIDVALDGLVLGNSLEKKETTAVLRRSREETTAGFAALERGMPGFSRHVTALEAAGPYLARLPDSSARRVRANLINRDLCQEGLRLLRSGGFAPEALGELLSRHHDQLRDGIEVSTPKIERMIAASLEAGAYGAKINGSGGGGCMFAYAPGREEAVAVAIRREGGEPYIVHVDAGARVDSREGG